ncbi:MAG TPA: sulfite exporter TauE/SafE family protein [Pseudomonadales bacterium]|nr:sulfite exporter TauE/SafE family protein [Pseudomonadales bacterium]
MPAVDSSMIVICVAGFLAGLIHVWSGVDHLAALMPLSFGRGGKAAATGAFWGLGHSTGVVGVALIAVALKQVIDIEAFTGIAERLVGVMLIALGLWGIRQALRMHLHVHDHTHDGDAHSHLHVHLDEAHGPGTDTPSHHHTHAAVAVGTLHGFAGGGHVFALLPALGLATWLQSCSYLAAFALGTVIAMSLFAAIIGWSSTLARGQFGITLARRLMVSTGSFAIAVGIAWLALPLMGYAVP